MWKVALKYALMCGAFLLLLFWISYRLGSNPLVDEEHFFLDVLIIGLFIFFSSKEFKTYRNGGILHFWQGMTLGFFTYLPAAIIFSFGLFIAFNLYPELFVQYKLQGIEWMNSNKAMMIENDGLEMFNARVENIQNKTEIRKVMETLFQKIMTGLFVTPVIAIILRKKPN